MAVGVGVQVHAVSFSLGGGSRNAVSRCLGVRLAASVRADYRPLASRWRTFAPTQPRPSPNSGSGHFDDDHDDDAADACGRLMAALAANDPGALGALRRELAGEATAAAAAA
jgi:hypothetical protein